MRDDELATLLTACPHYRSLTSTRAASLASYDIVILNPAIIRIEDTLRQEIAARWAFFLRAGGYLITFGIDYARVSTEASKLPLSLCDSFAPAGDWFAPDERANAMASGFRYLFRAQRAPGKSFLTWEVLARCEQADLDQLLASLTPAPASWDDLAARPQYLEFVSQIGAASIVHDQLLGMFSARRIRDYRATIKDLGARLDPVVKCYHTLNLARHCGVSASVAGQLREAECLLASAKWIARPLSHLILDHAVKLRDIELTGTILESGHAGGWSSVNDSLAIGQGNRISKQGQKS